MAKPNRPRYARFLCVAPIANSLIASGTVDTVITYNTKPLHSERPSIDGFGVFP